MSEKVGHIISMHVTNSGGTRLAYTVQQTLPSLAEVGLACETSLK